MTRWLMLWMPCFQKDKIMQLVRAWLFYIGLGLSTLIMAPVCILIYPLPFRMRFYVATRWTAFNLWWLRVTCSLDYRVHGRENIPVGPAIIFCKHQSAWETLALQLVFPAQAWVLKKELLWIPIYGWGLASMRPIAIDRGAIIRAFRDIVSQGSQRLADGIWVVIFPEGTRVLPGQRKKYLPGGGLLAAKTGYPVVPVAHNSGYFWPRKSIRKKPGTIDMVIGPVIHTQGKSAEAITSEAEAWIEGTCQSLPAPDSENRR